MALEGCCTALITIEAVRARLDPGDMPDVVSALEQSVGTLREAIGALRREQSGELLRDGVGIVLA